MIDTARQAVRREGFWVVALLLLTSIPELTTMVVHLSVTFSSVTIYAVDLVCAAIAALGAVRLVRGWRTHSRVTAIMIIGLFVLLLVGLIRGYALFGLQESVNNVRVPFYALAALLYGSTVPFRWSRSDLWGALPTLVILVIACLVRFAQDGLLIRPGVEGVSSVFELRPVTSAGALLLLVTALLLVTPVGRIGRAQLGVAAALVILLVLVQQRTVWICLVIGLGVLVVSRLVLEPGVRRRLGSIRIVGLAVLAGLAVLLVMQDAVLHIWGPADLPLPRGRWLRSFVDILGERFPLYDLILIAIGPLVLAALWFVTARTRFGMLLRAATENREMLQALGVDQRFLFTAVLAIGVPGQKYPT